MVKYLEEYRKEEFCGMFLFCFVTYDTPFCIRVRLDIHNV